MLQVDNKSGYLESTEFLEAVMSKQSIANSVNIRFTENIFQKIDLHQLKKKLLKFARV